LVKLNLVEGIRQGKDTFYNVTQSGEEFCNNYKEVREQVLVDVIKRVGMDEQLSDIATMMRTLSGFYDQASRAVRSL